MKFSAKSIINMNNNNPLPTNNPSGFFLLFVCLCFCLCVGALECFDYLFVCSVMKQKEEGDLWGRGHHPQRRYRSMLN